MKLKEYMKRAIKKNMPYNLTPEWVHDHMINGTCEVTGIKFKLQPNNAACNPFLPSIDRVDSNKGYTRDNCKVVIIGFNILKSNNSNDEVLKFCKGFVEYYENKK